MTRKLLFSALTLMLTASLCLIGTGLAVGGLLLLTPAESSAQTSVEPFPVTLPDALPDEPLPASVLEEMNKIQLEVAQLRRLIPRQAVYRDVLSPEELEVVVKEEFFSDYTAEDAQSDAQLLTALGLLPNGFELLDFYEELFSEQVAGYYDSQTGQMVVVQGEDFSGVERMTYAHEYTHALQDQTYDLRNGLGYEDSVCMLEFDACSAVLALIEGDATLSEQLWLFRHATDQDYVDLQDFSMTFETPVYDSAPEFMQQDFMFPYMQGNEFVQTLYDQGGWAAVDQAYANPPVSTEQILHPGLYPAEQPAEVDLPVTADAQNGWKMVDSSVLGEWYTFLLLSYGWQPETRIPLEQARQASAGWGGDRYRLYANEQTGQTALAVRWQADSAADARELFDALRQYAQQRWTGAQAAPQSAERWEVQNEDAAVWLALSGEEVAWLIAPDKTILDGMKGGFSAWQTH
ncbi:MAG: hypothetical protein GYA48_17005 [Chloroflexi bacterium]|nr:hypothetical protein [Chloroflexota bacterium]